MKNRSDKKRLVSMSRRRNRSAPEGSGGSPAWMTTFADLMSLLLTFFILLFSMSSISDVKFSEAAGSIQSVFSGASDSDSILDGSDGMIELPIPKETSKSEETSKGQDELTQNEQMYEKLSEDVENKDLGSNVSVSMGEKGITVALKDSILFESGRADLKEEGLEVLEQVRSLIDEYDNEIVIEGHTDNIPMSSGRYGSNWELSTSRAVSVVRYLAEEEDIDPERLSAVGYGEYRPIVANDSHENRATNRRVNILLIFEEESEN